MREMKRVNVKLIENIYLDSRVREGFFEKLTLKLGFKDGRVF